MGCFRAVTVDSRTLIRPVDDEEIQMTEDKKKAAEQIRGALEGTRELERGAPFRFGVLFGFVAVAFVSLFTRDGVVLSGVFFGVVLAVVMLGARADV